MGQGIAADGPLGEGSPRGTGRRRRAEGSAREGRAARGGEEEDEAVAWSYHNTVLFEKIRQAVRRATDREGEGASS